MTKPYYMKSLLRGGVGRHNFWTTGDDKEFFHWPLPQVDRPGDWLDDKKTGPLIPHRSGFNLSPLHCVLQYLSTENYLAEADGETAEAHDCVVARRVRLIRPLPVTPQQWRKLGYEYALTARNVLAEIDSVRPYLEENLDKITGAFDKAAAVFHLDVSQDTLQAAVANAQVELQPQIWRFAHDIPSSGLYAAPAKASMHATEALSTALSLMCMDDSQLNHAQTVKDIAYKTREAAAEVADDYVEHRGRVEPPHGLVSITGAPLLDGDTPDSFPRAVRHALFKAQNDKLLRIFKL